ncbi:UDP-N-acetylglucosamine 2-epimerase (non-hydrolyzing) [Clostridium perfringens]|uniref:non-hydrolyzing UDP-N-acetylglucosamine 2-epimerase n=1 Tax=Clostridium perfringens TaxID=1502 RepID=UPI000D9A274B|nr:UDP-N-acetylglucosamine 2-epimerase (non-hydrolyzing) [Clostridium perfringens]MDK0765810.1 UDP-N-acetylglucosamine 2-epimerase (non-hydrolyzing) [Clostridium perfringens]MDM0521981.1 UDP-N-acetylglucosamine 2-epimerase (non-hydrolyzing) [Clostridium perfringens]MDU4119212.1 UDP-N-acetylglucosamine 2-epimerase (non-hydrolyzing) [Clostridium perfringens]MDU7237233.1 UDP-N-acetylglucosamine 2-epimerase (non-hydrolyzing) [Clostridium perfringens]MDU8990556.1 UDP-N-acetylglucosamine 2-epimerase
MRKLKVMTIVGTRPEIIRLAETIKKCDLYFEHIVVHTGQNWDYTLNDVFFKELELREPNHFLGVVGNNLGETMGNIIAKSYEILVQEQPDALLILGDTNSCLSAIAAKRLKIPVFHMEAGNRCFDQNVPEEINRRIVDVTSDVNLAYTEHARRYLLSEGMRKEYTFVTGSPLPEVFARYMPKIDESDVLERLGLEKGKFILVSAHREENIDNDENFKSLTDALNAIAETYNMPVIYSTHPRSWKRIEEKGIKFHGNIKQLKPFGFYDYNKLQKDSFCVLSDSGSLAEESNIMGFPAVSIRTSTERPEAVDKGSVILGGITFDSITQAIEVITKEKELGEELVKVHDYTDINVSTKVVNIIQGYTSIINKFIWRK